jgi:endonuclease/exonuclease/phosphatase family metal-dependent hydrolase
MGIQQWCVTVGPPVIDSLPDARLPTPGPDDTLTVVTWNILGGAGDLAGFLAEELSYVCDGRRSRPDPGFNPFILLVQEAYRRSTTVPEFPDSGIAPLGITEPEGSGPRIDIVAYAKRCGLALFYAPSMRNGTEEFGNEREDKGNAILSSLPLHDFIAIELPFETQRRVAVVATVRYPGGDSLRVANIHLDVSPSLWRVLKTGNSSRLRQAMGTVAALNRSELSRSGAPFDSDEQCPGECADSLTFRISTVLAGDLNTWAGNQTVILHMYDHFPESPPWDSLPTRGEFPADHMFFRQRTDWAGASPQLVPGSYGRIDRKHGSDHFGRSLQLRLIP